MQQGDGSQMPGGPIVGGQLNMQQMQMLQMWQMQQQQMRMQPQQQPQPGMMDNAQNMGIPPQMMGMPPQMLGMPPQQPAMAEASAPPQNLQQLMQLQLSQMRQSAPVVPSAQGAPMMPQMQPPSMQMPQMQLPSQPQPQPRREPSPPPRQAAMQQGGFPSMMDLAKNSSVGGSSGTVQDNDVKIIDPQGRPVNNFSRFASFDETPFPQSIKADLQKAGFPAPSQIQQYTWPLAMQMRDVIGVAATGSGKTLSFLLPAFSRIIERNLAASSNPVLLVLAPTRELAVQIEEESVKFGRASGIKTTCCYGGAPKGPQASDIRNGVHGIIGTPGRVNDFLEGGQLNLSSVASLVLDEADRMLDMGFEPQIRKIIQQVPKQRHTLFFTATWPPNIRRMANEFLKDAYQVQIGNRDELKGNQDITQIIKVCTNYNKNQMLTETLKQAGIGDRDNHDSKGLCFCGTKKMCDNLSSQLSRGGIPCAAIHGDKDQKAREQALNDLKSGQIKLLVATDVAARGIDIKGVTLVVNYDLPSSTEDYVHRIGRTGRAGQKGYAVALVSERDAHALRGIIQVMKRTNQEITPEVEKMAMNAGPAPPPIRRGNRGDFGGKGGGGKGGGGGGDFFGGGGGGKGGGKDDGMCGDFSRGNCTRGDSCKFSHGSGGGGGMAALGNGGMGGGGSMGASTGSTLGGGGRNSGPDLNSLRDRLGEPGAGGRDRGDRDRDRDRRRSPSRGDRRQRERSRSRKRSPSRRKERSRSRKRKERTRSPSRRRQRERSASDLPKRKTGSTGEAEGNASSPKAGETSAAAKSLETSGAASPARKKRDNSEDSGRRKNKREKSRDRKRDRSRDRGRDRDRSRSRGKKGGDRSRSRQKDRRERERSLSKKKKRGARSASASASPAKKKEEEPIVIEEL